MLKVLLLLLDINNGLLINYGKDGTGRNKVTFPMSYTSVNYKVVCGACYNSNSDSYTFFIYPIDVGSFAFYYGNGTVQKLSKHWISIGY